MRALSLSIYNSVKQALRTSLWVLKIVIPVSFVVTLLSYFGIIAWLSQTLSPLFSLIGLPGEASIVYLSSLFLPLYAPIAMISTLSLTMREGTILALMCLFAHNLPVESAIQKRTGTPFWQTLLIRISASILGALLLNWLLPTAMQGALEIQEGSKEVLSFGLLMRHWATSSLLLALKIVTIITSLMVLQSVLRHFGIIDWIARICSPVMHFFGLPKNQAFLWLTAQTVGLAYGSAILLNETQTQQLPAKEINLFNYHIAVNHSLLEDTLIFAMIGILSIDNI